MLSTRLTIPHLVLSFNIMSTILTNRESSNALVLYNEDSLLPQHKPYKHFQFGDDKISIRQSWAQDGVAGIVWDAAVVLCEYIVKNSGKFREKNVLELGAGTGLAGLCAYLQGANVVVTDREERIGILKENVLRNTKSSHATGNTQIDLNKQSFTLADQTCDSKPARGNNSIDVEVLNWSDRENRLLDKQWDIVIGSDIIYIESSFDDLLFIMRHLKCSQLLLACRLRYGKDHRFIQRSKQYFSVKLVKYDDSRDIRLYSFQLQ